MGPIALLYTLLFFWMIGLAIVGAILNKPTPLLPMFLALVFLVMASVAQERYCDQCRPFQGEPDAK